MSVIINELELVVEPAAPTTSPTTEPRRPTGVTPADIREVLRHLETRRERVEAD